MVVVAGVEKFRCPTLEKKIHFVSSLCARIDGGKNCIVGKDGKNDSLLESMGRETAVIENMDVNLTV